MGETKESLDSTETEEQKLTEDQEESQTTQTETEPEADLEARVAELEDELRRTRTALKKANREAAQRRHQLKEKDPTADEELETYRAKVQELEAEVQRRTREAREERQRQQVLKVASSMEFEFPEDLLKLGDIEFDLDEETLDENDIKLAAKALARRRPGLLKKHENLQDIDAQRRGGRDDGLAIDEEEIARTFGIRNLPK